MPAAHVGVGLALGGCVAEVTPPFDHLFGRAAADTQLQAATADQVGRSRILSHVERVLVAHVDHAGAYLDPAGPGANRGQQREGRCELLGEVVNAEIRAVGTQLLGRDGQIDRLQQHVRCGPRRGLGR